ncbi:MAG: lysophospholipid acyltransferase family protein [Steroidobacteraceae bacterium]
MLFLRSLIFNVFLYVFTALCSIVAMLIAMLWPRRSAAFARGWSHAWLKVYEIVCGVSYQVKGREHLPDGGCIIAMKHQSTWDTFAMFAIFREPVFVFKQELARIPFFGWTLLRMGCIPIKRGAGKAALDSMIEGTVAACSRGKQVVIFPEGTRGVVGQAPAYKTGVSHLYQAIGGAFVPVALNSGLLWPRHRFLRPPGVITVEILPPIPPGLPRKDMQSLLAEGIEEASQRLSAGAGGSNRILGQFSAGEK